jgi:hypothetical protein
VIHRERWQAVVKNIHTAAADVALLIAMALLLAFACGRWFDTPPPPGFFER